MVILNPLELFCQLVNILWAKEIAIEFHVFDYAIFNIKAGINCPHIKVFPPLNRKFWRLTIDPIPVVIVLLIDLINFFLILGGNHVLLILNLLKVVNMEETLEQFIPKCWHINILVLFIQVWAEIRNP